MEVTGFLLQAVTETTFSEFKMLFAVLEFENDGILKHAEMKRVFDFFVRIFCPPKNRNKTVCVRNKIETQF
jgi:hypothetical protein